MNDAKFADHQVMQFASTDASDCERATDTVASAIQANCNITLHLKVAVPDGPSDQHLDR